MFFKAIEKLVAPYHGPDIMLNTTQVDVLLAIYWFDAVLLALILCFCLYIIAMYLCNRKEKKLGFIYIFYTYAVILCSLRLAQSILVITRKGSQLQDY